MWEKKKFNTTKTWTLSDRALLKDILYYFLHKREIGEKEKKHTMVPSSGIGEIGKEKKYTTALHYTKHLEMVGNQGLREWFGKRVGNHVLCRNMLNLHFPKANTFSDEVIARINVSCLCMMLRVAGKSLSTLIVHMKCYRIMGPKV